MVATTNPGKYHGSRIQVLEVYITTLHQPLGSKKPEVLGKFDVSSLLPKYPRIRSSFKSLLTSPLMTAWHQPTLHKHEFSGEIPEKYHTFPYISIPTKMGVFNDRPPKMTTIDSPPFSFSPHRNAKDTRVVSWRQNGAISCAKAFWSFSALGWKTFG